MFDRIKRYRFIKDVEKALGIKLYKWQINYIMTPRPYGMYISYPKGIDLKTEECVRMTQALYLLLSDTYSSFRIYLKPDSIHKNDDIQTDLDRANIYDMFGSDASSLEKQKEFINVVQDLKHALIAEGIQTNDIIGCFCLGKPTEGQLASLDKFDGKGSEQAFVVDEL